MASETRRAALAAIAATRPVSSGIDYRQRSLSETFGCNVFGDRAMRERLPAAAYAALRHTIERGVELDPAIADLVANAMKEWAIERGATHFTHWFQPMTGLTAEKHDSFLGFSGQHLVVEFSGKALIKGEPDASSFPSGGLRSTFEARGYTAWDPTSPAFLREDVNGRTLCIPTAFCSWTGEALDKKTPLLRSIEAVSKEAVRMCHLLGMKDVRRVTPTLGPEQEYFLVDRNFFLGRPDLMATGRTLVGARPPKGQELEDHYFGAISPRVLAFMQEAEYELWKLGVPIKTRHNEVAPSQFEVAPIFEHTILAADHNMLCMEVLRVVALRHGFVCLLHEKPFAGVNGSGKHNNWSVATDTGENLLDPGHTPWENARFVVFLTAVIQAVDSHADLLRASIAHAANDHRLGANEAPPAIISVYLGGELDEVVRGLIAGTTGGPNERKGGQAMRLGVSALPPLPRDATDRNRTSPFAFTGNKFEFRAVGSSQSVSTPNVYLNTAVADSLRILSDKIEEVAKKVGLETAIQQVVQATLKDHYRIVFNGNNYSKEWELEAEKRGLPNLRNTVDAVAHFANEKNFALFEQHKVFSRVELASRAKIAMEGYEKALSIEAQALIGIAQTSVLPAAFKHQQRVAQALVAARSAHAGLELGPQEANLRSVSQRLNELTAAIDHLQTTSDKAEEVPDSGHHEKALWFRDKVKPAMERCRAACDALEAVVDDDLWPLPKYREMLFVH